MDFAKLDLKAASENGSWVHLEYDGKPMFADDDAENPSKPCRIRIRGMASKSVVAAVKKIERINLLQSQRLERAKESDADSVAKGFQDQMQEAGGELILAGAFEWENIHWDEKKLDFNQENVLKICGPATLFYSQVRDAIMENKRLFPNAAKD